jgi:hypothetical protein
MVRHPVDGRVHFSELKELRKSPVHYKYACETAREITRPMRVGYVSDRIVFGGGGYEVAEIDARRGKAWDQAMAACPPGSMLVTQAEYADACGAAQAVLADPIARARLDGCEFQRVMQWESYGLRCAAGIAGERGGFDAWCRSRDGTPGYIADLKTTASADPDELARHVYRMCWHAQAAWYLDGAKALCLDAAEFYLICVEASPPHPVTVLRLPEPVIELGRRALRLWTERLRACDQADVWPGYVQSEVELEVPAWMQGEGESVGATE